MGIELIDPYGAQELFCTGLRYESAAPGIVRILMYSEEPDAPHGIIRVKLVMPLTSIPACISASTAYVAANLIRRITEGGGSAVVH